MTVPAAFMHVRDNIEELGKVADETNLLFLKGLLDDPVVESLVRVSKINFKQNKNHNLPYTWCDSESEGSVEPTKVDITIDQM